MNTRKTLSLLALSLSATPFAVAAEFTLFAAGVDPNDISTYYNINQGTDPTCWAAVGSNIVAHWQDHHVKVPNNAPKGTDVYETFLSLFSKPGGGNSNYFFYWWLGHYEPTNFYGTLKPDWESLNVGGYYEDVYRSLNEVTDIAWRRSSAGARADSRAIFYALNQGLSLGVGLSGHALTVYGASFDTETELVTSLYVCDSSGYLWDEKDISRIYVDERYGYLYLFGYYGNGVDYDSILSPRHDLENIYVLGTSEIETVAFINGTTPIPEPSAFALLAGLGVLVFAGGRRHRQSREI